MHIYIYILSIIQVVELTDDAELAEAAKSTLSKSVVRTPVQTPPSKKNSSPGSGNSKTSSGRTSPVSYPRVNIVRRVSPHPTDRKAGTPSNRTSPSNKTSTSRSNSTRTSPHTSRRSSPHNSSRTSPHQN